MLTKRWKHTEYAEMWQWKGSKDNRGVVFAYPWSNWRIFISDSWIGPILHPGDWIIKRGDTYEVITNAEFEAQGWEEVNNEQSDPYQMRLRDDTR